MKITVINGTEKHGMTWRLKEMFLERFKETAEITEFCLPRDCPDFCMGCVNCIFRGEHTCKDAIHIQRIAASLLDADLIVMTSPAYVMHVTGAMKAMLDHFAYLWMPHRPAPQMFTKRAVIITQCLGAGARSAARDIRASLSWWGISEIRVFKGKLMSDIVWDRLTEKKRSELTLRIERLAEKISRIDYGKPSRVSMAVRVKFGFCRMIQKSLHKKGAESLDGKYWDRQGWLGKVRPWKGLGHKCSAKEETAGGSCRK